MSLNEENKSSDEVVVDVIKAFDVIKFNVGFLKTFHDFGIPLRDQKSKKMMKR
jgi:hypothetical protein